MLRFHYDIRLIDETGTERVLSADSDLGIRFSEDGTAEICRFNALGNVEIIARMQNGPTEKEVGFALLYKYSDLLRADWMGTPLDLTPNGIERAQRYFRSGDFLRRARFLGLVP